MHIDAGEVPTPPTTTGMSTSDHPLDWKFFSSTALVKNVRMPTGRPPVIWCTVGTDSSAEVTTGTSTAAESSCCSNAISPQLAVITLAPLEATVAAAVT